MYRQNYILILFLCLSLKLLSQDKKIDSLLKASTTERSDTLRAKLYLKISGAYLNKGIADSAYRYASECYVLSKKANFLKGLGSAGNFLGQVKIYKGELDSAIYYFKNAMANYKLAGDVNREAGMLNNLGVVYKEQGNISKSLDCYFKSLRIKESVKDTNGIANAYTNLGHLCTESRDSAKALMYYRSALDLRRKVNDQSGVCNSLLAIGLYYQTAEQLPKALDYLNEALKISEALGEEETIAIASYNVARVYYKQHRINECTALYQRSLDLSRKNHNTKGIAACLETLGQISLDKKNTKQALAMFNEAYALAKEIDSKDIMQSISYKLSEAYETSGDFKNAFSYLKISNSIKDSLFNSENIRKLTSEGLKYEHEKERLMLQKEQEKKEALAKAESFRKTLVMIVSIVFVILISVFSFTILKKLNENRRQKEIIEEQRNEMISSINYAKRIQYALLAHTELLEQNLPDHFVLFKPKDIVSGDFYWATLKNDFFYLAVCDCTGHGVPGAFMSLLNINFLHEAINEKEITAPHDILNYVRNRLIEKMESARDGMDAVVMKIPVTKNGALKIEYAAANNSPLLIRNNGIINLPKDKMPVGRGEIMSSFNTHAIELQKGDSLYLYTDGFPDQFGGPRGKKFKHKQLDATLLANSGKPLQEQNQTLEHIFENWRGKLEQIDDVCIVGIRV